MFSIAVVVCTFAVASTHAWGNGGYTQNNGLANSYQGNSGGGSNMNPWSMINNYNSGMGGGMNNGMSGGGMNNGMSGGGMNNGMSGGMNYGMNGGMGSNGYNRGNSGNGGNMMQFFAMMMMMKNMMNMNMNNQGNQGNRDKHEKEESKDGEDMRDFEQYMEMKMMQETGDMMMVYMKYKKAEEQFKMSMEHMCWLVTTTYAAHEKMDWPLFNATTKDTVEDMAKAYEGKSDEEKLDGVIKNIQADNGQMYGEIFLRMATWACESAHDYEKSYMEMDSMKNGHTGGKCGDDKDDKDDKSGEDESREHAGK